MHRRRSGHRPGAGEPELNRALPLLWALACSPDKGGSPGSDSALPARDSGDSTAPDSPASDSAVDSAATDSPATDSAADSGDTEGGGGDTGLPEPSPARVYVMERYDGTLLALDRDSLGLVWSLPDLPDAVGLAVDVDGYIYIAATDTGTEGSLLRVDPDGLAMEELIPADGTLLRPQGLWYDPVTHSLLLCDVNADTVYELHLSTLELEALTTTIDQPSDAARRPGEDTVYITARAEGEIYALEPGAEPRPLGADVPDAHSLVPGPAGRLYAMATATRQLLEIEEATGRSAVLAEGFTEEGPVGLCWDALPGQLLLTDHAGATLFSHHLVEGSTTALYSNGDRDLYECGHDLPYDADADGHYAPHHGGDDCDDRDPERYADHGC